MSEEEDKKYKGGNALPDGSYEVGKNKPPRGTQFRKGDGRQRGRRKKGTANLRTDFQAEMESKISLTVNGKKTRVTRQRAIVMRLMDNASRGQPAAIRHVMDYGERFGTKAEMEEEDQTDKMPGLKEMSSEELEAFGALFDKALGLEPQPEPEPGPFAYLRDPNDPRNYTLLNYIDGVHVEVCDIEGVADKILSIDNRAYCTAVLASRPACFGIIEKGEW